METLGDKIYNLRKERGVSQEKLAEKLNVSRITISRWENNTVQPTTENIKCLCEFFGVESAYFFEDAEEIAVVKTEPAEQVALPQSEAKKEPKLKMLKIVLTVVGMVLLALLITACGIATCLSALPVEGQSVKTSESIDYGGIISLVVGIVAATIFITLSIIFIIKFIKNRKNK